MPRRALILLALAACGKVVERPSPRTFLEKYRAAIRDQDVRRMIELHSRASRHTLLAYHDQKLLMAKSDPEKAKELRRLDKLERDPATFATAEEYLFAALTAQLKEESYRKSLTDAKWVGEESQGDRAILRTEMGGRVTDTVLVWEDGGWKLDIDETANRNRPR